MPKRGSMSRAGVAPTGGGASWARPTRRRARPSWRNRAGSHARPGPGRTVAFRARCRARIGADPSDRSRRPDARRAGDRRSRVAATPPPVPSTFGSNSETEPGNRWRPPECEPPRHGQQRPPARARRRVIRRNVAEDPPLLIRRVENLKPHRRFWVASAGVRAAPRAQVRKARHVQVHRTRSSSTAPVRSATPLRSRGSRPARPKAVVRRSGARQFPAPRLSGPDAVQPLATRTRYFSHRSEHRSRPRELDACTTLRRRLPRRATGRS